MLSKPIFKSCYSVETIAPEQILVVLWPSLPNRTSLVIGEAGGHSNLVRASI